jgi:hypothetical protein
MPLENVVRRLWVDIYINVVIVVMSISDTTAVVIDIVQPAKTHRKKSGFWQDRLH